MTSQLYFRFSMWEFISINIFFSNAYNPLVSLWKLVQLRLRFSLGFYSNGYLFPSSSSHPRFNSRSASYSQLSFSIYKFHTMTSHLPTPYFWRNSVSGCLVGFFSFKSYTLLANTRLIHIHTFLKAPLEWRCWIRGWNSWPGSVNKMW